MKPMQRQASYFFNQKDRISADLLEISAEHPEYDEVIQAAIRWIDAAGAIVNAAYDQVPDQN